MLNAAINRESISAIDRVIRPYIRRTPIVEVEGGEFGLDCATLIFKLELLQHSGSLKARGAFANLLTRDIPSAGVVAASGGNHGAAVAFAAQRLGKPARIFVPRVASAEKIDRIRSYGADLVVGGERYADALAASEVWAEQSGALRVHAYDQVETLLGQGTAALEFDQQSPKLDSLLVAVGGGGLIGGVASWYANRIRIVGVEPEAAPTLTNALQAGKPVDSPAGGIAADSLAPKRVGEIMFPIAQSAIAWCWSQTLQSCRRRRCFGKFCASWLNREAQQLSPRCCVVVTSRKRENAWAFWCAAEIPPQWIS